MDFTSIVSGIPSAILASLVGAAIAGAILELAKLIRRLQAQRTFPLEGTYLSKYEDEVDGDTIIQKATASFRQRGLDLTGSATDLEVDRNWHFKLNVDRQNFIHRVYWRGIPETPGPGSYSSA